MEKGRLSIHLRDQFPLFRRSRSRIIIDYVGIQDLSDEKIIAIPTDSVIFRDGRAAFLRLKTTSLKVAEARSDSAKYVSLGIEPGRKITIIKRVITET